MNFADPQAEVLPIPPAPGGPGGLSPTARCPPVPQPGPGMLGAKLFPWPGLRGGSPKPPQWGRCTRDPPGGGLAVPCPRTHRGAHSGVQRAPSHRVLFGGAPCLCWEGPAVLPLPGSALGSGNL